MTLTLRDPRLLLVASLAAASVLCLGALELRIHRTGDAFYEFLAWNLFLAWIPLVCALIAHLRARRSADWVVGVLLVVWLLFFPNAPYVLTDFIHLGTDRSSAPLWYDALMLSSFAWTALLLGFTSAYFVQAIVRRSLGEAWSWLVLVVAFALASFGVYLGRFVRFNSWDALVRPVRVLHVIGRQVENPLEHPRLVGTLLVLTTFLLVGYLVVYSFAELHRRLS